ncbi:unnamed protein product [Effrenium voratum]|nr:unnamed protein product [Effrenium voratum]
MIGHGSWASLGFPTAQAAPRTLRGQWNRPSRGNDSTLRTLRSFWPCLRARRSRAEPLHPLEALELARKPRRCHCGARLGRPKCLSLVDLYRPWSGATPKEAQRSNLIGRFLRRQPAVWAALLRPEYHTWHSHTKKFHKELSESLATIEAFELPRDSHAVDLCCGKPLPQSFDAQ